MSDKLYTLKLRNMDGGLLVAEWAATRRQSDGLLKSPVVAAPAAIIFFQFSDGNSQVGNPSSNRSPFLLKGTLLPTAGRQQGRSGLIRPTGGMDRGT